MAKYKVIALSVGGVNNKIYKSKDIVDSVNFGGEKRALELVKKGFLAEIKKEVKPKK
mgnify:CR=1 FL=1|tara:strand:+ start:1405 stop:1575 length:171 start_codon:yes stop_codon:yes gene_type:complete